MNLEFRKKLGNFCKDKGLDITDETNTCVCINTNLMQFAIEYCIYKDKFYAQCHLIEVYLKGKSYTYCDFSIIGLYYLPEKEYKSTDDALSSILDFIENCPVRQRMLKTANSITSLIDDLDKDDSEFALEFIKYNYDI